jgi:hypothetical protein
MCKQCTPVPVNRKLENPAMPIFRRSVLTATAAIIGSRARAADTLVVTGYGGEYRDQGRIPE